MKVFKPKPFYACCVEACDYSWRADRLRWTSEGWMCRDCEDEWDDREVISHHDDGTRIFKSSESPEWDGKTLEEYLNDQG